MITKKSVAAVAIALGMTASVGASSYASNDGSDAESSAATTQRAVVKVDRAKSAAADKSSDTAKRKCVGKKKIRKLKVFTPYKKIMKRLPRPTYKNQSGGLRFRSFNACTTSISNDLDLVFKKQRGKWKMYQVSVYWS